MADVIGSELLGRALKSMEVDTIFFLPGGPTRGVVAECFKHGIRLIGVRHEQAAAMMAHAYSRITGRPGVCMSGRGADSMNLVTGVANAFLDGAPMVAISGSIDRRVQGKLGFQELDQVPVMKPITKAAWEIPKAKRIPEFVTKAFRHALANNPGPVYLSVPEDVLVEKVDEGDVSIGNERLVKHRPSGDPGLVKQALDILAKAERPIILSGSGVVWSEASAELQELVDLTGIPFYTTPLGRGVIPEDYHLCFLGARNTAWAEADAVLVVGTRASFIISYLCPPRFASTVKVIEVNIDAEEIGHNRPVDVGIQGDAKAVLRQLIQEGRGRFDGKRAASWVERLREIDKQRKAQAVSVLDSSQKPIHPLRLCKEIRDFLPREAILVVDGHVILNLARQSIPCYYPGRRLNPGPSGCMGVGVPFGIGAKAAMPELPVMVLSGDGAFGFNGIEMDTALRYKLPVVVVISNNGGFASPRAGYPAGTDLGFTRYDKLVEALGGHGEFVEEPEAIRPALERAFASGLPACVNVIVDREAEMKTQLFAHEPGDFKAYMGEF